MSVGPAVRGVEGEVPASTSAGLVLERLHEGLTDSAPAELLADDQSGDVRRDVVALDHVLHVQSGEPGDLSVDLRHDQRRRRISFDARDSLGCLRLGRRISQVAEKHGNVGRVPALGSASAYGGGGGPPGGAWSSTYVVLLRPHWLP